MLFKHLLPLLITLLATGPLLGQGIDLSNIVAGDVIDNSTVIPDGAVINLNGGTIASGTLFSNADFPNGVTLNINDGVVGLGVEIHNSTINVSGGQVAIGASNLAEGVNNFSNTITVTGGDVGGFFQLRGTSTLQLDGGRVESFGTLLSATATVTGGAFTLVDNNGDLNISGGEFNTFRMFPASASVNLFGTEFAIDSVPMINPGIGSQLVIPNRNVTLSGTLEDGSTFSNFLDSLTPISNLDFGPFPTFADLLAVPGFASANSTVTVTFTSDPILLGDVNCDDTVDFLDISPFIALLSNGDFLDKADIDQSGAVDFLDISPFITILSGTR